MPKQHKTNVICECCGNHYRVAPKDLRYQADDRSELAKWFYEDDLSYHYFECPKCGHRHELLYKPDIETEETE